MNDLKHSKAFYILVLTILVFFVWSKLRAIALLSQIVQMTWNTLFIPTIFALFIYYLLKPLYLLLLKYLKNQGVSLAVTFFIFFGVLGFIVRELIPLLFAQIDALVTSVPRILNEVDQWLLATQFFSGENIQRYLQLFNHSLTDFIDLLFVGLQSGTQWLFVFVSSSFLVVSIVPIMVFYLLKNTKKPKTFHLKLPPQYQAIALDYFTQLEKTLSDYISGKALVCFYVFVGAWLTFWIAGLKGALLFAVVAGIMDIVPYFGPWIGAIPAVITGMITQDVNAWILVLGIILVQIGESYIVSPYVMSKELKLHPLFVIIMMLITGQIFGILGMIVILPIVAALKVTLLYGMKLQKIQKAAKENRPKPD
ncbi:AI-2E family transporter [Enterococcus sp. LJL98]